MASSAFRIYDQDYYRRKNDTPKGTPIEDFTLQNNSNKSKPKYKQRALTKEKKNTPFHMNGYKLQKENKYGYQKGVLNNYANININVNNLIISNPPNSNQNLNNANMSRK